MRYQFKITLTREDGKEFCLHAEGGEWETDQEAIDWMKAELEDKFYDIKKNRLEREKLEAEELAKEKAEKEQWAWLFDREKKK